MSARDVAFTLMALGHVAGCRGKTATEILAEAVGEIVRLETLASAVMPERHEMHDRLLARAESAESERDKYKAALKEIQALYPNANPPAVILARGIARTALEYTEEKDEQI